CLAVATLAIGSGAATTTLSVVDSILLEPLAYPEGDELVSIWHDAPGATLPVDRGGLPSSASMYVTYAEQNRVFEHIGIWTPGVATITGDGEPEEVPRIAVTTGLLEALGVAPLLGRWFSADDRTDTGGTVILSYGYWQRRFGGDPNVIGRTLTVNAGPREIVGVMPPGFRIADTEADLLMGPMTFPRASLTLAPFSYPGIARLKPGMTVEDANADVARMISIWQDSWPAAAGVDPRIYTDAWKIAPALRPLKQDVVGDVADLLWVFMATIAVVLLIAYANVTNLMLIRGTARRHELAIRAALGAGVGRLRRTVLLESLLVALLGGLAGLAIAAAALRGLVTLGPATLPRLGEVALDADVVVVAIGVALLAGVLVGLVQALRLDGWGLNEGLHAGGRTSSGGRAQQRVQRSLVITQVALAVVVLISAGLSIRTVVALRGVAPGFSGAEQVQTLRISMRDSQVPDPVLVARRQQEILDAFAALPGVTAVGLASSMPMDRFNALGDSVEIEGRPKEPVVRRFKGVSPGVFGALGVPLAAGRDYSWQDLYEYRPVVMISEAMARDLWQEPAAALGKRLRTLDSEPWREIIGVVADVREDGLRESAPQVVYWPVLTRQGSPPAADVWRSVVFAVRSNGAGNDDLNRELEQAVWSVDPNLPVTWVRTLKDIYDLSEARTTFTLVTLVVAASAALALGVVGLYGVLSYAVALRRREIAIRLALGAQQRELRRRFVRAGVALASLGIAIGMVAAAGVTRLMASLLFGVEPVDPLTFATVAAVLIAVAALASYLPARRASSVDPAEALAAE
ncbi:MAG TPA: ABC transporter permease, partial [Gammaproteobacteria bacterium]